MRLPICPMYIYLKEKGHATLLVSGAKLDFGEGKQEGYNWETCQSHLKRQIWRVRGWKRRVAPIKLNYVTHYARWGCSVSFVSDGRWTHFMQFSFGMSPFTQETVVGLHTSSLLHSFLSVLVQLKHIQNAFCYSLAMSFATITCFFSFLLQLPGACANMAYISWEIPSFLFLFLLLW